MPTAVIIEVPVGETAESTDLASILGKSARPTSATEGNETAPSHATFITAALNGILNQSESDQTVSLLEHNTNESFEETLGADHLFEKENCPAIDMASMSRDESYERTVDCNGYRKYLAPKRNVGPNEELYTSKYANYVRKKLSAYRDRLPDYRVMNEIEQAIERNRVQSLLARLNLSGRNRTLTEYDKASSSPSSSRGGDHVDDSSTECDFPSSNQDETFDKSMALLTPKLAKVSIQNIENRDDDLDETCDVNASEALLTPMARENKTNSSTESIEVARSYGYLDVNNADYTKKRLASTSGKRGTDAARFRMSGDQSFGSDHVHSFAIPHCNSDRTSPTSSGNIFSASQSPIYPCSTPSCDKTSLHSHECDDLSSGDAIGFVPLAGRYHENNFDSLSIDEESSSQDHGRWKDHYGITGVFHMKPLQMEQRERHAKFTQGFHDPFETYRGSMKKTLAQAYKRIHQREEDLQHGSHTSSLFLSFTQELGQRLVLKLILESGVGCNKQGKNLIVCRTKEEIEGWCHLFREQSPFSVLNHTALSPSKRKTTSSVSECAQFDIVLTTYDALKSQDVTVVMDANGFAKEDNEEEGWYSSRSNSQTTERLDCKQLSILHRMCWSRIVFIDIVGRKSYLAKYGTSRAYACRAVNATARYAFLLGSSEYESTLASFLKCNRDGVAGVSSILRLENTTRALEDALVEL